MRDAPRLTIAQVWSSQPVLVFAIFRRRITILSSIAPGTLRGSRCMNECYECWLWTWCPEEHVAPSPRCAWRHTGISVPKRTLCNSLADEQSSHTKPCFQKEELLCVERSCLGPRRFRMVAVSGLWILAEPPIRKNPEHSHHSLHRNHFNRQSCSQLAWESSPGWISRHQKPWKK